MHIFLYEFVTGGGWFSYSDALCPESLLHEGRAMVEAIGTDLANVDGVTVTLLHDARLPPLNVPGAEVVSVASRWEELAAFRAQVQRADATLLIVPEAAGFLAQRASMVEKLGSRLLGPSLEIIRLTSDKHLTAEHLSRAGIATPRGVPLETGDALPASFSYPAILKPRDGAGSLGVQLVTAFDEVEKVSEPSRLELYYPGQAASVAFLCGPAGNVPLRACGQRISGERNFVYEGGLLPLPAPLEERAVRLAAAAVNSLGETCGYVGVDLVLGAEESTDVVIEINPRLTTSYVGLRAAARSNLAAALLQVVEGQPGRIEFDERTLQFDADGRIW